MQAACEHCGQQHLLQDNVIAKHSRVQFRCTRCSQITVVEVKRRAEETMVISPMPSFARADARIATLRLPPVDESLSLPMTQDILLQVTSGPDRGAEFVLKSPRTVIGRKGADFALTDPEISRHHCLLEVRDHFINLKDLDSTNGTFLEEERVRAAVLQNRAEFRIGNSSIQLSFRPR